MTGVVAGVAFAALGAALFSRLSGKQEKERGRGRGTGRGRGRLETTGRKQGDIINTGTNETETPQERSLHCLS